MQLVGCLSVHTSLNDPTVNNMLAMFHTLPTNMGGLTSTTKQFQLLSLPAFTIGCEIDSRIPIMKELKFDCAVFNKLTTPSLNQEYHVDFFSTLDNSLADVEGWYGFYSVRIFEEGYSDTLDYENLFPLGVINSSMVPTYFGKVTEIDTTGLLNNLIKITLSQKAAFNSQFVGDVFGGPSFDCYVPDENDNIYTGIASGDSETHMKVYDASTFPEKPFGATSSVERWQYVYYFGNNKYENPYYWAAIIDSDDVQETNNTTYTIKGGPRWIGIKTVDATSYWNYDRCNICLTPYVGFPYRSPKGFKGVPFYYSDNTDGHLCVVDVGGDLPYSYSDKNRGLGIFRLAYRCLFTTYDSQGKNIPATDGKTAYHDWATIGFKHTETGYNNWVSLWTTSAASIIRMIKWASDDGGLGIPWSIVDLNAIKGGLYVGDETWKRDKAINDFIMSASMGLLYFDGATTPGSYNYSIGWGQGYEYVPKYGSEVPPFYNGKNGFVPVEEGTGLYFDNGVEHIGWTDEIEYYVVTEKNLISIPQIGEQRYIANMDKEERILWNRNPRNGKYFGLEGGNTYDPRTGATVGQRVQYHPFYNINRYMRNNKYIGPPAGQIVQQKAAGGIPPTINIPPPDGDFDPIPPVNPADLEYVHIAYYYLGLWGMKRRLCLRAREVTLELQPATRLQRNVVTPDTGSGGTGLLTTTGTETIRPGDYIRVELSAPSNPLVNGVTIKWDNLLIVKSLKYDYAKGVLTIKGIMGATKQSDVQGWK